MRARVIVAAPAVALLVACATQSPIKALWTPDAAYWNRATSVGASLRQQDGSTTYVPPHRIRNLVTVKEKLEQVSGVRADLGLVETNSPNAFAFYHQGRPIVAVSLSWLDQLGDDVGALATMIGHELAHLHLGHSGQVRKEREEAAAGVGQVIGTLLNLAGVPMGGTIGSMGATAFFRSFTRDEERAADDIGIRWAVSAGYDPCGHARTVKMFQRVRTFSLDIPFLSTHPGYGERSELANRFSTERRGRSCDE